MPSTTFEAFDSAARADGFDEVIVREWDAHLVLAAHRHPFAVKAVVARGEFWLDCDGTLRLLRAGEVFELAAEVPHSERYGAEGATVWVARRHAAA
jgi:quercetin dioxygenase-like cupin family protein